MDFILRHPTHAEMPFVYAAWIRTGLEHRPARVWRSGPHGKGSLRTTMMPASTWAEQLKRRIERLRELPDTTLHVADADGALIGFVCYGFDHRVLDRPVLHFLYVDSRFRRRGVATEMLRRSELSEVRNFSHWSPIAQEVRPEWVWDESVLEDR